MKKWPLMLTNLSVLLSVSLGAQERSPGFAQMLDQSYRSILVAPDQRPAALEKVLAEMPTWDPDSLLPDDRLEYDAYGVFVRTLLTRLQNPGLELPGILPTPLNDPLVFVLTNYQPLSGLGDVEAWLARLAAIPDDLERAIRSLRDQESHGILFPRMILTQMSRSLDRYLSTPAANGELAGFFRQRIKDQDLQNQVIVLLEQKVYPAVKRTKSALDDLAQRAASTYSLVMTPQDDAPYEAIIADYLGESLSARSVHEQALSELAADRAANEDWVPGEGDLFRRVQAYLKTEPLLSSEDIPWARQTLEELRAAMPQWTTLAVPAFDVRYQTSDPVANYIGPSEMSTAHLNLGQGLLIKGAGALLVLAHEGLPGHAFQMGVQLADETQPQFRREVWPSAFVEGWARYAESLLVDLQGESSPYERAALWMARYRIAVVVVLDTGLNGLGWTYKEAQSFLLKSLPGESIGYDGLINRSLYWPGQFLSYWYGYRQMIALRDERKAVEGDAFDLRSFHDRLITIGAYPFSLVRRAFSLPSHR